MRSRCEFTRKSATRSIISRALPESKRWYLVTGMDHGRSRWRLPPPLASSTHRRCRKEGVKTIRDRRDSFASRRRPCVACASVRQSHATWSSSRVVECGASGLGWEPPPPPTAQSLLPRLRPVRYWPGRRPSRGSSVCICGPNRMGRARCAPVVQSSEQSWNECTSSEAREPRLRPFAHS